MIKQLKKFHEWRELIIWIILVLMILLFFNYIFYIIEKAQSDYIGDDSNITINSAIEEDSADVDLEPRELLDDSEIKIVSDESSKNFEVWNSDVKIGDIKRRFPSQIEIFKRIKNNLYIGAVYKERGDYVLFEGPNEIYRLNLEDNSLADVLSGDCLVSDISPNERYIASLESFYVGEEKKIYLNIRSIGGVFADRTFQIAEEYGAAGNAYFSEDGNRIFYEAAFNNPDREEFAMFMVDLETGEQGQVGGNDSYNKAKEWAENS